MLSPGLTGASIFAAELEHRRHTVMHGRANSATFNDTVVYEKGLLAWIACHIPLSIGGIVAT
jgi:hypothetical protein